MLPPALARWPAGRDWSLPETRELATVAVMLSGQGSNLKAMLAAGLPVRLVVADRSTAPGLAVARQAGLAVAVLERLAFPTKAAHEDAIAVLLEAHAPRVVALAGYMRVLGAAFCRRFAGRLVNLHPSLLPALPGRDTHRRAIAAGHREHGCTVHWVTPEVDGGPIIRQACVGVRPDDSPARLAARVRVREHALFPAVLHDILAGKVLAS